jgi:hypothetical protein
LDLHGEVDAGLIRILTDHEWESRCDLIGIDLKAVFTIIAFPIIHIARTWIAYQAFFRSGDPINILDRERTS